MEINSIVRMLMVHLSRFRLREERGDAERAMALDHKPRDLSSHNGNLSIITSLIRLLLQRATILISVIAHYRRRRRRGSKVPRASDIRYSVLLLHYLPSRVYVSFLFFIFQSFVL